MSREWWGFIFLMLIMKVPIVYLGTVIWWAVQEPKPKAEDVEKFTYAPSPVDQVYPGDYTGLPDA